MSNKKTFTLDEIIAIYNSLLEEAKKNIFYVRDADLQKEQIDILSKFKNQIKSFRYKSIEVKNEAHANMFFHMQCVLNSYISVLSMWCLLKENNYHEAWNKLIDSYEYLSIAFRASNNHFGLDEYREQLEKIETAIFPGFPFYNSVGLVVKGGICSICQSNFEECEHVEEKVYMGMLCRKIEVEVIQMEHSAIVPVPKDRRCIISEITTDDGYYRDYFSWKKTRKVETEKIGKMLITCCLMNFNEIDI